MTSQPESPVATKFVKRDDEFWRNVDEVSKKVRANPEIYGDHRRPKIMESKDEPVGGTEQKGTRKWAYTRQRSELKRCPFCGTQAIEQGRLADNSTDMHYRITCGNPFCNLDCATHVCAALVNAEHFWQERSL